MSDNMFNAPYVRIPSEQRIAPDVRILARHDMSITINNVRRVRSTWSVLNDHGDTLGYVVEVFGEDVGYPYGSLTYLARRRKHIGQTPTYDVGYQSSRESAARVIASGWAHVEGL